MTMAPGRKDYGYHSYPLERFEKAIGVIKQRGNRKIGIAGASTTGMMALVAASIFRGKTAAPIASSIIFIRPEAFSRRPMRRRAAFGSGWRNYTNRWNWKLWSPWTASLAGRRSNLASQNAERKKNMEIGNIQGVSETMLQTLFARAAYSRQKNAKFHDSKAVLPGPYCLTAWWAILSERTPTVPW